MTKHWPIGGSTAYRTLNCPAWVALALAMQGESTDDVVDENAAARRGTFLHSVVEQFLDDALDVNNREVSFYFIDEGGEDYFAAFVELQLSAMFAKYEDMPPILLSLFKQDMHPKLYIECLETSDNIAVNLAQTIAAIVMPPLKATAKIYLESAKGGKTVLVPEQTFALNWAPEYAGGTADFIMEVWEPDLNGGVAYHLEIGDYKFGNAIEVTLPSEDEGWEWTSGSAQLIFYAMLAYENLPDVDKQRLTSLTLNVMQMQNGEFKHHEYGLTRTEALSLFATMRDTIRHAIDAIQNESGKTQPGAHCQYCPNLSYCPSKEVTRAEALHRDAVKSVGWWITHQEELKQAFKQSSSWAKQRLLKGLPVPGAKLVKHSSKTRWTPEAIAKYSEDFTNPEKLKPEHVMYTPKQALDLELITSDEYDSLTVTEDVYSVVSETDPRQELVKSSKGALGRALQEVVTSKRKH